MSTDTDEITTFLSGWMRAELAGEATAIGERLSDDFDLTETRVRRYGDTAVVVGQQTQSGGRGNDPLPFPVVRITLFLERTSGSWRLAGTHISFIAGTPGAPPLPDTLGATTPPRSAGQPSGATR